MKKLADKRWVRVLAAVLFFVFLLLGCAAHALVSYGRGMGWYNSTGSQPFEQTEGCLEYVYRGLYFVSENAAWSRDLTREDLGSYAGEGFSYVIRDGQGNITADTRTEKSVYVTTYIQRLPNEVGIAEEDYSDEAGAEDVLPDVVSSSEPEFDGEFTVEGYVNLPVEPYDGCYSEYVLYSHFYEARYLILTLKYVSAALTAFMLLILCLDAASRGKAGKLRRFMRLPFDLVLLAAVISYFLLRVLSGELSNRFLFFYQTYTGILTNEITWMIDAGLSLGISILAVSAVVWYMSGQLGARILLKNLLTARIVRKLPHWVFPAVTLLFHVLLLVVAFGTEEEILQFLLIVFDALVFVLLLVYCRQEKIIQAAAKSLAGGDLSHKVGTKKLYFGWRSLGEELNSIGDGMAQAVEERMKSERMKTELITNVSHDLKTPLTSIINYVDFLKSDNLDESSRREYLAVLEKQSLRLKKLTEDVVEASKAASGALTVTPEPISMVELLEQFLGEYTGRFREADIEAVLSVPEQEVVILADSGLLGRVMDNLVTNILKYAQPGTRAYFDLTSDGADACLVMKNTSREQLNITADELMERFVRGGSSRHTDGSGLGLSIARSLTELMGGRLELILDGDLFKARIVFPLDDTSKQPLAEQG